jgi:hypothetical protein
MVIEPQNRLRLYAFLADVRRGEQSAKNLFGDGSIPRLEGEYTSPEGAAPAGFRPQGVKMV